MPENLKTSESRPKYYITTAIDYVNAPPHLGHALEKVIADTLARYHRLIGNEVFFLTGTDEHGLKVYRAAQKSGEDVQSFVDEISGKFKDLKRLLNLSFDDFVRTTEVRHISAAQELWRRAQKAGDLYKKKYKGLYCVGCEAFKTAAEIKDGHCTIHPNLAVEEIEEENYFFKLTKYQKQLLKFYEENPDFVVPESRYKEIINLVKEGLTDVSVSRPAAKLPWGIPVPDDPTHVMYVWFDALTNYLTGVGFPEEWSKTTSGVEWWSADLHVIGKDITRFHAALWPAMLISAKLPLPKQILVHGFISTGGERMSKSLGNVIDPEGIVQEYGTDALRYILLRHIPTIGDGDLTAGQIKERYNGELVNGLGNLLQRTIVLLKQAKAKIPPGAEPSCSDVFEKIEKYQLHEALAAIWKIVAEVNAYIDKEKPWELIKASRKSKVKSQKLDEVLVSLVRRLETISKALSPFMPDTAASIKEQLVSLSPEPLFPRKK
jgi:methionyl-tRNA synthetase